MDFVFMLTRNDRTVADGLDVLDDVLHVFGPLKDHRPATYGILGQQRGRRGNI